MNRVPLRKPKPYPAGYTVPWWRDCQPFILNDRAVLIHRPRSVTAHSCLGKSWIAVHNWCGNSFTGSKKFTFLDAPPAGRLVCERCESMAVQAGEKSSSELAGHHVCVGKVKAYNSCPLHGGDEFIAKADWYLGKLKEEA